MELILSRKREYMFKQVYNVDVDVDIHNLWCEMNKPDLLDPGLSCGGTVPRFLHHSKTEYEMCLSL